MESALRAELCLYAKKPQCLCKLQDGTCGILTPLPLLVTGRSWETQPKMVAAAETCWRMPFVAAFPNLFMCCGHHLLNPISSSPPQIVSAGLRTGFPSTRGTRRFLSQSMFAVLGGGGPAALPKLDAIQVSLLWRGIFWATCNSTRSYVERMRALWAA